MTGTAISEITMVPSSWTAPGDHDATVTVTEFFDQYAGKKRETAITLADLADRIRKTTQRQKESLPWVKMARFGDDKTDKGSLRHDANIIAITGIEADYDGEAFEFVHAVEILTTAGIKAIAYTSPSHKAGKPRWRILCPLSQEHLPSDRDKFMGRLNGLFAGIFSAESWAWSQSYFYGSVKQNKDHSVELIDGDPIDEHDDLDRNWTGKPDTSKSNGKGNGQHDQHTSGPLDTSAMLKALREGTSYHMPMVRLAGYAACHAVPLLTIRKTITDAMQSVYPDQRDARWRKRMDDLERCLVDIYGKEFVRQASAKAETAAGDSAAHADTYSLASLEGKEFKPIMWVVPTYIAEGLTVLAGKPKIGKSWLMLNAALGVARGKEALDQFVDKGDVLYCGLEDGERRMKERVDKILGPANKGWPANFDVRHRLDTIDAGGIDTLEQWLIEHVNRRLVVIDTLGKVRGRKQRDEEPYQYDYRIVSALQELATRYRVAIVLVHHVRKSDADDILDTVSGTTGIAGAADTVIVLGTTKTGDVRLYLRGRDAEEQDKILEFDHDTGSWAVTGDHNPEETGGSQMRRNIADLLAGSPTHLTPSEIAARLDAKPANIKHMVRRMVRAGEIFASQERFGAYAPRAKAA